MRNVYRTVKASGETQWEIEKSLFIAHVARAETEEQACHFVQTIQKKYRDANHNCFAYIAGTHDEFQKADDDGEPAGTAGKPMLEVIKKSNLHDTVIVITRYFGGVKLGAGGLIRAYSKCASLGIKAAGVLERTLHTQIGIDIPYPLLGIIENQLQLHGYIIKNKQFTDQIRLCVLEVSGQEDRLRQLIKNWTAGCAQFSDQGYAYLDRELSM